MDIKKKDLKKNIDLAEFFGIMLGDGNIYINKRSGHYLIRVFIGKREVDYRLYVSRLIKKIFGVTPKYYLFRQSEYVLYFNSKSIAYLLLDLGLVHGDKKRNKVRIPHWIFANSNYLKACIRGLVDTDDCLYKKYKYPKILQIEFYSGVLTLLLDFRRALIRLGFKVSRIIQRKNGAAPKCGIYSKEEVKRYCDEIGFKNPKHLNLIKKVMPRWCSGRA